MVNSPRMKSCPFVVGIVQARMKSTRLPGKVLKDVCGRPMIGRVLSRARTSKLVHDIVVATTDDKADDAIVALCMECGWKFYRGSEVDVLDRFYKAACQYNADVIVRLCADNPLLDGEVIDMVVRAYLSDYQRFDYASNTLPPQTFPIGMGVEVFSFSALERAWREDTNLKWREHVTAYMYKHPDKFKLLRISNHQDYSFIRWTVDTKEDLELVRTVYKYFGDESFSWREALKAMGSHPDWLVINRHISQRIVED